MGIEPIDDAYDEEEERDSLCSVIVDLVELDNGYAYEFHLVVPDKKFVNLGELKALRNGLAECLDKVGQLIEYFDEDDEDESYWEED